MNPVLRKAETNIGVNTVKISLKNYRPFTNKATIALLVLVMTSFGLFAETRVEKQPNWCDVSGQSDSPRRLPLTFVLF